MRTDWWESLGQEEVRVVVVAALMPPPISLDHLVEISSQSPIRILRLVEGLVDRGVFCACEDLGKGYYRFGHIRDVQWVLGRTSPDDLHKAANQLRALYERTYEDGPKKYLALAHLAHMTGIKLKNVEAILRSGQYCLKIGLKEEAAIYFRIVIERQKTVGRTPKGQEVAIDATLGLLQAQGHLIPLKEQKGFLEQALRFAQKRGDLDRLARLGLVYAQVLKSEGDYEKAKRYFDQGWSLAQELGKDALLKWAALSTTDFLFWQGRVSEAVARYEQVIGSLEELPSDETTLRACAALGWCYGICGETSRGIGLIDAVRARAVQLDLGEVKIYADLMTVLALVDARRIPEAERYLNELLTIPEDVLGHYVLWAVNGCMAYVRFTHGDLEGCFAHQKQAYEHSRKHGWPHHRGPYNFEYIDGLEKAGIKHPEMNYDAEVMRMLNWPDMYMQGVGLRYKAQRSLETSGRSKEVDDDLRRSLEVLSRAGAKLELARTQLLVARLLLQDGKSDDAQPFLDEAWKVFSGVNEDAFPDDLRKYVGERDRETLLIKTVVEVGTALGTVRNQDQLLQRIINLTMRLARAERGGFFLINGDGSLVLAASRNLDPSMVASVAFRDNFEIIRQVASTGAEILKIRDCSAKSTNREPTKSGWMICSPVVLQDRVLGVLYLDSSLIALPLPEEDVPLLKAIGNQVAIALDNVQAYQEIAVLKDRLEEEPRLYRMGLDSSTQLGEMVGTSEALKLVHKQVEKVAPTDSSVLITGETGVGKGLVAAAIHRLSSRAKGPFIPVNTILLSQDLVASELFGHERGAFTGAVDRRLGRFELADGGTIFLDDVDGFAPDTQAKLLRALQDKEFERVGGDKTIKSDFRVIAATNQNLREMVKKGLFRSDLYYRLNIFPIHIPPLRERREDIPVLALHFLETFGAKMGKRMNGIPESHMRRLMGYHWPGNVRELRHIIERAVILTEDESLRMPNLEELRFPNTPTGEFVTLEDLEKRYIIKVLEACDWRVSGNRGAAKILNVKPTTLYSKMRRLGINKNISYVAI